MRSIRAKVFILSAVLCLSASAQAQVDEGRVGAWYMYLWSAGLSDGGFGLQGDVQHRNWDLGGDLEQWIVRGAVTWSPEGSSHRYSVGLARVISEDFGPSRESLAEKRFYQEALIPQRLGERWYFTHRFRLEQRDVEGQDFRNRLRYFLGLNVPLNQVSLGKGAVYLSFYNELFENLERDIGGGRRVDYYDRNRAYAAIGFSLSERSRLQFGYMYQDSRSSSKGQLQFNLFQNF